MPIESRNDRITHLYFELRIIPRATSWSEDFNCRRNLVQYKGKPRGKGGGGGCLSVIVITIPRLEGSD